MTRFSYKVSRPIHGIKEENHYRSSVYPLNNAEDNYKENAALDDGDIYAIKTLKDKIKILEIELQKAREESFQAGYQEGKENTLQDASRRINEVTQKMQQQEECFIQAVEKLESPVLELAKRMAQVVLNSELKLRDDQDNLLLSKLRDFLYQMIDQNKVIIKLNPEQLSRFKNRNLKEELDLPNQMELTQIADGQLAEGETKIQTEDFFVDGTYSGQLDHLEDQLKDDEEDV